MLDTFISVIEESLLSGQDVSIPWFGKFWIARRPSKKGYNPHTKESMTISGYSTPVFKPWIRFKEKIKNKFPN
jgi:DNA-binding protein HU-beta